MRFVFDLDNTLCEGESPYRDSRPKEGAADVLRDLKARGHEIVIYTARGMGKFNGSALLARIYYEDLTARQLKDWGFQYDELILGKPSGDVYIDDKGLRCIGDVPLSALVETALEYNDGTH